MSSYFSVFALRAVYLEKWPAFMCSVKISSMKEHVLIKKYKMLAFLDIGVSDSLVRDGNVKQLSLEKWCSPTSLQKKKLRWLILPKSSTVWCREILLVSRITATRFLNAQKENIRRTKSLAMKFRGDIRSNINAWNGLLFHIHVLLQFDQST